MFALVRIALGFGFAAGGAALAAGIEREIALTPQAGASAEDREIARWQQRAGDAPGGAAAFTGLAWAYVAKARRTMDAGYYSLADKAAIAGEAEHGATTETRLVRGHVAHNLHRFHEAEKIARTLVAERGAPADLALLSDALVEQGKLAEGIAVLQRLEGLKPGPESWSRIAHVRGLKGDNAGARVATLAALRALHPRETTTRAWFLVRLSALALQEGDATGALVLAEEANALAPAYPPGLFARGRALAGLGRAGEAVTALQGAVERHAAPEYAWWLAELLAVEGRGEEAQAWERRLRARGAAEDPRTLALFLATRGAEPERALRLARTELKARADVFSHDALAWALFAAGDFPAAAMEMRAALAEGTRDARLSWHAGEIALANGEAGQAAEHFARAAAMEQTLTPMERARLARRISALNQNKS